MVVGPITVTAGASVVSTGLIVVSTVGLTLYPPGGSESKAPLVRPTHACLDKHWCSGHLSRYHRRYHASRAGPPRSWLSSTLISRATTSCPRAATIVGDQGQALVRY
jgi:hypothetical protein